MNGSDHALFVRLDTDLIQIASSFSKLEQLQTLNIRNLPEVEGIGTQPSNDHVLEGLGTMFLNIITKHTRTGQPPALMTLAIGASTYASTKVGMSISASNAASALVQLHIYHVNYDSWYSYRGSPSPKLHLIAIGKSADRAKDVDIFSLYWLDGALHHPNSFY